MRNNVFAAHDELINLLFGWWSKHLGSESPIYPHGASILLSCLLGVVSEVEGHVGRSMPFTAQQKDLISKIIIEVMQREAEQVCTVLSDTQDDLLAKLLGADWGSR